MPAVKSSFKDNLTPDQFAVMLVGAMVTAMNMDQVVRFIYDGKERVVQPHAIGKSTKDGSLIMRGWQVAGESSRGVPSWSLFTIGKIKPGEFWVLDVGAFTKPATGYQMDDKQMDPVLVQIDTTA